MQRGLRVLLGNVANGTYLFYSILDTVPFHIILTKTLHVIM